MTIERNRLTLLRAFLALQFVRKNTPVVPSRCDRMSNCTMWRIALQGVLLLFNFYPELSCDGAAKHHRTGRRTYKSYEGISLGTFRDIVPGVKATRPAEVHDQSRVHVHPSLRILPQWILERAYIISRKLALEAVEVGCVHVMRP